MKGKKVLAQRPGVTDVVMSEFEKAGCPTNENAIGLVLIGSTQWTAD
jgi:hypothetical protein